MQNELNIKEFSYAGAHGVTAHGSTAQTILLARALYRSDRERTILRRWLDTLEADITYSNEDFDRKQGLAAELADMIRREVR